MIQFLPLTEEHVDPVLEIYNHYVLTSTATFSIETLERDEMKKILFSGHDRYRSYVIMEEDTLVGYVLLARYKPREAYDLTAEVTIYLKDGYPSKGIGTKALEFIENIAKGFHFHALLAVICAENIESVRLFEKFQYFKCAHFKEVGKKFDRLLDVVIYEKLL